VKIEGKDLKAGTYGLFLAVSKEGPYTWVFSKNSASWECPELQTAYFGASPNESEATTCFPN